MAIAVLMMGTGCKKDNCDQWLLDRQARVKQDADALNAALDTNGIGLNEFWTRMDIVKEQARADQEAEGCCCLDLW